MVYLDVHGILHIVGGILVHTSTLIAPFDEELYARMINLSTVTPSVASKYHITAPSGEENYDDIAVGRLSDTDAVVYFREWWVQEFPCTWAEILSSVGNTITISEKCKSFISRFSYKIPIGRTATTFILRLWVHRRNNEFYRI